MLQVNTLVTTFVTPMFELTDNEDRVHASLNLNTETGRLVLFQISCCHEFNCLNRVAETLIYKINLLLKKIFIK
jgi:hypothetical protein